MTNLESKRDHLLALLRDMGRVAVAFSGGIDSTVVAKAAQLALGDQAVAVTADSPSVPRAEIAQAEELARASAFGIASSRPTNSPIPITSKNDGSRCYFCKDELYGQIEAAAAEAGVRRDLQRRQPRRPGRLSSRPDRGGGAPGSASAAGGGLHQGRRACPGAGMGPADLGQARVAVPVEPARAGRGSDAGTDRPRRGGRGVSEERSAIANSACACTKANWPASRCRRTASRNSPTRK